MAADSGVTNPPILVKPTPSNPAPPIYFWISLLYLLILVGLALVFLFDKGSDGKAALPQDFGPIPAGVPWWGAVGAVTISLYGIFFHVRSWDDSFDYWHLSRPFLGAVLAMVAYMIFVTVIDATGVQSKRSGSLVYYLVAFLVGYREATFHLLIQRATDVLFTSKDEALGPGQSSPGGPQLGAGRPGAADRADAKAAVPERAD